MPTGGTTDYAPQMIHNAFNKKDYTCFVNKHTCLPFIVMPDANMSNCIDAAIKGRMLNNGQSCIAAKRFIIHSSVYDEFISGL